jgi:hypothetical protein
VTATGASAPAPPMAAPGFATDGFAAPVAAAVPGLVSPSRAAATRQRPSVCAAPASPRQGVPPALSSNRPQSAATPPRDQFREFDRPRLVR